MKMIFKIWKSKSVCTTLTRQHKMNPVALLKFSTQILKPSFTFRQLIASSFYKTYAFVRYAFGRNVVEFQKPITTNYALPTRNPTEYRQIQSILSRIVNGERFFVGRINAFRDANSRFRRIKFFANSGLTLGLVGVCVKNENGFPMLLPESETKRTIDFSDFFQSIKNKTFDLKELRSDIVNTDCIKFKNCISKGCSGVVYEAEINSNQNNDIEAVAVKMLFNYDIESNAAAIINSTIKECVPYNGKFGKIDIKRKKLPPHPNIVKIISVFADDFKLLQQSSRLYPDALPLKYGGYGRNMTLFIVEKLYDMTLKKYLEINHLSSKASLAILTQCLDAIEFLNKNNISHRDLKTDNILVSILEEEDDFPWIVLADFGLCSTSLAIPFQTEEICRGGNRALMAPEIVTAVPQQNAFLDYRKADLWSLGTIAYEIFGGDNPFYKKRPDSLKLDSALYVESELPVFPSKSWIISELVAKMLLRDVTMRPSPKFASELCHLLYQLGPTNVDNLVRMLSKEMRDKIVSEWFKLLSYNTMYEIMNGANIMSSEYKIKMVFLAKFNVEKIKRVLDSIKRFDFI